MPKRQPLRPRNGRLHTLLTYQKLKSELDRDCQIVSWLDCESKVVAGKRIVLKLRCSTCAKFKVKIASRRNFSDRWIVGADSVRTSDHGTSLKNCPTIFEKWPIKIDFVLTNGLPNFRPYFVRCYRTRSTEERRIRKKNAKVIFYFAQEISRRTRWWCLKCVIVYLAQDIPAFVMYCVNGESGSSLLIKSKDSMIILC